MVNFLPPCGKRFLCLVLQYVRGVVEVIARVAPVPVHDNATMRNVAPMTIVNVAPMHVFRMRLAG